MVEQSIEVEERSRAVIIERSRILLIKRTKPNDVYWVFPGGGIESGETPEQAVARECREELGVDVVVDRLLTKERSSDPKLQDRLEYFYICRIVGGDLGNASGPEYQFNTHYIGSYELAWILISDLKKLDLRPNNIRDLIIGKFA